MSRIRQAVVLAGGKGTRLGALTAETPKPLLPVGGRPFVEWVIANLARQGVGEVILTIGYRAEAFETWLSEAGRRRGGTETGESTGVATLLERVTIHTFVEDEPLDTGGALAPLKDRLDEAFLVLNGDTLFDVPLDPLRALLTAGAADAAIGLRTVPDTSRYGSVALDGTRVTAFAEKSRPGPGLINGGVYALTRAALTGFVAPFSIERDLLPGLVGDGRLRGLPSDGFFIDIGVPESFEEAQRSVPEWWERVSV